MQKDSRVKVIHKKNESVSKVRNIEIQVSTGDFAAFVDSDDWIEKDTYETMINYAINYNADVVHLGLSIEKEASKEIITN